MSVALRKGSVVAIGSLLLLAACGGDEAGPETRAKPTVQVERPDTVVGGTADAGTADDLDLSGGTDSGGGGGFGAGSGAAADGGIVKLHVMLVEGDTLWGEPIEVAIRVENTSAWPVHLTPLAGHALGAMHLDIHGADERTVTIPFRGATTLATVDPREALLKKVDLLPFLRDMRGYDEGTIRFTLRYAGVVRVGGGEDDDELARSLVSEEFAVDISPPAWVEDLGFERDVYDEVASMLDRWDPKGRNAKSPAPAISSLGEPGLVGLCWAMERLGSSHPELSRMGGRALLVAREIGAPVQAALRQAASTPDPTRRMALGILGDDVRAAKKLPPPPEAALYRKIAAGDRGASLEIMVRSPRPGVGAHLKLDRHGVLSVTRNGRHAAAQLETEQLVKLKRAIIQAAPWRWAPARRAPRGDGEGRMSVVVTSVSGTKAHVSLHRLEGVRDNPFSAALYTEFMAAAVELEQLASVSKRAQATSQPR